MKTLREILRLKPRGMHRRSCRCADIPTHVDRAGTKWTCPECSQTYVAEILTDAQGRYTRWLLK